jgi:hypothetical protein
MSLMAMVWAHFSGLELLSKSNNMNYSFLWLLYIPGPIPPWLHALDNILAVALRCGHLTMIHSSPCIAE